MVRTPAFADVVGSTDHQFMNQVEQIDITEANKSSEIFGALAEIGGNRVSDQVSAALGEAAG